MSLGALTFTGSAAALLLLAAIAGPLKAQPADAPPGTICVTSAGWCWAPSPGPPGGPCQCPTPIGWVSGTLR
jgi:hypothetical protein